MNHNNLGEFVAHARKKGMDHATIRMLLLSAGWREKDVLHALSEETLDMAVPVPPDRGGAREAFFHLLAFASLYTTVISLAVLFFSYINYFLPDPALERVYDPSQYLGTVHWSMAAVIVTFPLFAWMTRLLLREMRESPDKSSSLIRRWLTYLTLFAAAMALIANATTLLFNVLQGELTLRFLLKVLVIFVLAGLLFSYYFFSLRSPVETRARSPFHRKFAIVASAIVAAALILGFALAGSPMTERERRFDEQRLQDLQTIHSEIQNIVYDGQPWLTLRTPQRPVPATLDDVQRQAQLQYVRITDPQTGEPYEYTVKDRTRYDLCATFNRERAAAYDLFWNHPAGRSCFSFDVTDADGRDPAVRPPPTVPLPQ